MATQHPDAASRYVSIQEEPNEAINTLTPKPEGMGLDEIMIDFEGKLTPYQQTSQIVLGLLAKGIVPGRDVQVTPRIPSGEKEGVFRQLMALMSIVESNYNTQKEAKIEGIKEVISPMTTKATELLAIKERVIDVIELAHKEFGLSKDPRTLNIIPLFESVPPILECGNIIKEYLRGLKKLDADVDQVRVMLGCSDIALSYGMPTSALLIKVALSELRKTQDQTGVSILPILGGGTLPFRGFVSANNEHLFVDFPGIKTITVQSAQRYDHSVQEMEKMASWVRSNINEETKSPKLTDIEQKNALNFAGCFSYCYLDSFSDLIELVVKISDLVPSQRDRLARKSEVGYARDAAHPDMLAKYLSDKNLGMQLCGLKCKHADLPRAISFTAALYSIGLPPEIIGTGRGLKMIKMRYGNSAIKTLLNLYPGLAFSLKEAGRYLSLDLAKDFLSETAYKKIKNDVDEIEQLLEIKLGPETKQDNFYRTIIETMKPMLKQLLGDETLVSEEGLEIDLVKEWLIKLGKIRKALG